ncbi:MAG: hypothetical protein IMZ61_04715 [Planctomycetes bacterium]|nr:hypothetical protein [Planctomycetota bacterium]
MGIERFYTESSAVYDFSASATWPFENTWSAITGSPFNCSYTELSGDRARVGGATESRGDGFFSYPVSVAMLPKYRIKWDSRSFEIVQIKRFPESPAHHQEVYVKETPEAIL